MQIVTNQAFVRFRGRSGRLATFGGFAVLLAGLILTWVQSDLVLAAYLTLPAGYLLISYGTYNTIRWGTKPRVDQVLATSLKTLDHRHYLFNYVEGLPCHNLLLTPTGLVVLEVRPFFGEFTNRGRRWQRKRGVLGFLMALSEGSLGNPTADAEKGAEATRRYLAEHLGEEMAAKVPIDGVVVFTHPRAQLTVEEPEVPVAAARDLRAAVRRSPEERAKLPHDVYLRLAQLLRRTAEQPESREESRKR